MEVRLHKQKVLADDFILASIIVTICILFIFFHLLLVLSLIVYPLSTMFIVGVYKLINGLFNKNLKESRLKNIIFGSLYIPFSILILSILFSRPNITKGFIIYFFALAMIIIGFAGIIKGVIIKSYLFRFRIFNMIIGILTIFYTIFAFKFAENGFIYNLILIPIILLLNGLGRSALYLSEYRISILYLRKLVILKFLFQLINEVPIQVVSEEAIEYIDKKLL
ncbi:MAG: hypothetical protein ACFE9T_02525 [Promethearchaeota archaeon]